LEGPIWGEEGCEEREKKEGDLHVVGITSGRRDLEALEIPLSPLSLLRPLAGL